MKRLEAWSTVAVRAMPDASKPLSWGAACRLFRLSLQEYLKSPFPKPRDETASSSSCATRTNETTTGGGAGCSSTWCCLWLSSWPRWMIRRDLDLLAATVCSACLVVISSAYLYIKVTGRGLISTDSPYLTPRASVGEYIGEVVGAGLLLFESVLGWWLVRRRRFLSENDSENALRREIRRYLQRTDGESNNWTIQTGAVPTFGNLTSLTGVYPVFRTQNNKAKWSRVPSLLLVKGDWVALQVGDICPANVIPLASTTGTAPLSNTTSLATIAEGERLTAEMIGVNTVELPSLPKGRTTILPPENDLLLTLCNGMTLFVVQKSPIDDFLRRPKSAPKSSRLSREVQALREFMCVFAVGSFVVTALIVFGRQATSLFHMPFLAALAALPVAGPSFGFFVEIIGTARILAAVHPHTVTGKELNASLLRYIVATIAARLSVSNGFSLRIPPASVPLLESLGVATALTLVDDELACEPHSVPQQLLVPSAKGLKLLDLCAVGSDNDDTAHSDHSSSAARRHRGRSFDSDSDSDGTTPNFQNTLRRLPRRLRLRRQSVGTTDSAEKSDDLYAMQFEDPGWWQYLPSLKCIGLACLLVDDAKQTDLNHDEEGEDISCEAAKLSLARRVCHEKLTQQLRSLAQCIGFRTEANESGARGDITSFEQWLRLHIVSSDLLRERLTLDAHERSSEQSRWWGLLRPDSTSVVVQDKRTSAFQLLTVGDPIAVSKLCNEAWQGEISTILPLSPIDRKAILDTSVNWKLGDLDVAAFSYAPLPHTGEQILNANQKKTLYLLDNSDSRTPPVSKDKNLSEEWTIIKNQVFLGVLGSLIVPRSDIQSLLSLLDEAGVRFVYFSPRNMRRQKELAIQMGIDVAWNCAISLRALDQGQEEDPHRMMSNYADWDVKAKLPHGVEAVRVHLEEVDNVPLLVSLFTDSTKQNIMDMVTIFQDYHDTVISVGMSHLPRNAGVFEESDIAVGIEFLSPLDEREAINAKENASFEMAVALVSSISSQSCAFRLQEPPNARQFGSIIMKSRSALHGATASGVFLAIGSMALSIYVALTASLPFAPTVPLFGSSVFLQLILPCLGLSMCFTDSDGQAMKKVPPKNDTSVTFNCKEGTTFFALSAAKSILPALLPQLLHLVVQGSVRAHFSSETMCPDSNRWTDGIRCTADPSPAEDKTWGSSGMFVFMAFVANIAVASAGCMHRFTLFSNKAAWTWNFLWLGAFASTVFLLFMILHFVVADDVKSAVPWYSYLIATTSAVFGLFTIEALKRVAISQEVRAEKLRRLQFETRLGAWSPR